MGDAISSRTATRMRPSLRIPLKACIFLAVTFVVLFPNPFRFGRHVSHLRNLQAMIDPAAPELAAWEQDIRQRLSRPKEESEPAPQRNPSPLLLDDLPPQRVQAEVQSLVYEKVRYDWDWNVWGSADYLPTVSEMFRQADRAADGRMREDCDGRSVIAASLMKRLGYEPAIVTDLRHVWVTTPQGEWMGPGRTKTIVSTPEGNRTSFASTLGNVPVALSFGVAVFPLWRELIILAAAYFLMLHRRMIPARAALAGLFLLQGLLFLRAGYPAPERVLREAAAWPAWVGIFHLLVGFGLLIWSAHRGRRAQTGRRYG